MKKILLLLILSFSLANSQTTGFLQNFENGDMTGWKSDHERTFKLSIDSTFLKITYTRTASSDPWDNFNLTLPNEVDVSKTPKLYVRAKADIPVIVGLKPIPVNPVHLITKSILGDSKWKELFFEITNTANRRVTQVYCYLDGGSTQQKSGTVWFDEIRIGDSVLTLPANFTELEEAILSATVLLNSSVEGNGEGGYPPGSKTNLQNTISDASSFLSSDAQQSQVDSVTSKLYDACSIFESLVNTIPVYIVDKHANKQTRYLYLNLQEQMNKALLFGMHDATGYGVGWTGDDDRSDVKDVCGDYPAVYSEDLNKITRDSQVDRVRYRLTSAYRRGGVITMCWHQYDPDGRSFYADEVNKEKIVSQILPGGARHADYLTKLKRLGDFFKSLRGDNGEAIPVIFRPYHEHSGGWFWWGVGHCTMEEYNQLWQFTADYLHNTLNVHNLLWAISPSLDHVRLGDHYFDRFPGNDYVDIYGTDYYYSDPVPPSKVNEYRAGLHTVAEHAINYDKIPALTEVGQEGLDDADWFTKMLIDPIKDDSLNTFFSYAAVWRNESTSHHFAPYPGHPAVSNFIDFYNNPYTLFESDLPDMYVIPEKDLDAPIFTSYPKEPFVSPSTSVEINIVTNERTFLRWSYVDENYDAMTNQFQIGERNFNHTTFIDAEQGTESAIYVHAVDIYGNKTNQSIEISFSVDTLQAIIFWNDIRYPVNNWNRSNTSLGCGSEADNLINEVQTAYFVRDFELTSKPSGARSVIQFNGGFALYINGVEAARVNMPADQEIAYDTEATSTSKTTKSINFSSEIIELMKVGTNKIAVEVHGGPNQSIEYFDALLQTNKELPFNYGSEWYYYDLGNMPESYTLGEITGVKISEVTVPEKTILYQNYPNPFNSSTTFKYGIHRAGLVTIEIYNILGQKERTLLYEFKQPGMYEIMFDSSDLANGVYMYVLKTNSGIEKRKMILTK